MEILQELKTALKEIEKKLSENVELNEKDMQILFLKSLIEEETGNGASAR